MNDQIDGYISTVDFPQISQRNFPIKSFYSEETQEIYTFYRQGIVFTVNLSDNGNREQRLNEMMENDKKTTNELGPMYLLFDKALVTQSSGSILFFKKDETGMWSLYDKLEKMRGQIFFIKGNIRIQVTTDEYIYFYLIDKETIKPKLENVMFNFMKASQMMFGTKVRYCVTFKQNEARFTVWSRKYFHNFKVNLTGDNLEGAVGLNLVRSDQYVIGHDGKLKIYSNQNHEV